MRSHKANKRCSNRTQSLSISSLVGDLASCGRALPRCIAWCSGSIVAESDVRPTEENVACGALIASGMRCCAMQVDVCRCLRACWAVIASSTYSHGDYRSHGGWCTLVTTTNPSKSSQHGYDMILKLVFHTGSGSRPNSGRQANEIIIKNKNNK